MIIKATHRRYCGYLSYFVFERNKASFNMLPILNIQRLKYITKVNVSRAQCLAVLQPKEEIKCNRTYIANPRRPQVFGIGLAMSSTSSTTALKIPVAYYDEIKDLPNHREKLLVDVREQSELQTTGRIPTSINVPLGEVQSAFSSETTDEQFARKYNHTKPNIKNQIILSCQSGKRSQIAAETLVNLGYKQIKNYKGSWLEWAEKNGLPK